MGLFNSVQELFNQDLVRDFNEFYKDNDQAVISWLQTRYQPRSILPEEHIMTFENSDKDYQKFLLLGGADIQHLNLKQKRFLLDNKSQIVTNYLIYDHFNSIHKKYHEALKSSFLAVRYLAEKYLGATLWDGYIDENLLDETDLVKVTYRDMHLFSKTFKRQIISLDKLEPSDQESIVFHISEIHELNELLRQKISECRKDEIDQLFIRQVVNKKARNKYYDDFIKDRHMLSTEDCLKQLNDLDDYVSIRLKNEYDELSRKYPRGIEYYDSNNKHLEGNQLEGEEKWLDCIELKDEIKRQHFIALKFDELLEKYPNAIAQYLKYDDAHLFGYYPDKEKIVNIGEEQLLYYEGIEKELKKVESWLSDQERFTDFDKKEHSQFLKKWSCYKYDVKLKVPGYPGQNLVGKFSFLQHFFRGYCAEKDLDYSCLPKLKSRYERIPEIKNNEVRFKESVYDQIMDYIIDLNRRYTPILVLIGDSLADEGFNEYQLNYLTQKLKEKEIFYGTKLINKNVPFLYKYVVIVEVISTIKHMEEQCMQVLSEFKDCSPIISYITIFKEFSRNEAIITIERHKKQIEEEKKRQRERDKELSILKNDVKTWYVPDSSELHCFSMYYYYPTTCEFEVGEFEWAIRNLIWDFKANPHVSMPLEKILSKHKTALRIVANQMKKCLIHFFEGHINQLTLVCVPSSSKEVSQRRYEDFSSILCEELSMINAYQYVHIKTDGEAKHLGGNRKAQIEYDTEFFKDKFVLLFDDVITSGSTMESVRNDLENLGAKVIGGFSIGKTTHEYYGENPIDYIK